MEARVKERLTGAVVLVAIVVILVPELLSGPKRNVAPPPGSHTVRIDLTGPHHVAPAAPLAAPVTESAPGSVMSVRPDGPSVPVASEPAAAEPVAADAPPPEPEAVPGAAAGPPLPAKPVPNAHAGAAAAPPPAAAAAAPIDGPPPGGTAAQRAAPGRDGTAHAAPAASAATHAPAAATGAPQAGSAPPAVSGWVVQLGSFANRENAQKLVQELHHKEYSAFVAEYRGNGKVLYRVRVGPEQDRARADALRLRLGHEGYTGSVTPHP
jgi:DedD protein